MKGNKRIWAAMDFQNGADIGSSRLQQFGINAHLPEAFQAGRSEASSGFEVVLHQARSFGVGTADSGLQAATNACKSFSPIITLDPTFVLRIRPWLNQA